MLATPTRLVSSPGKEENYVSVSHKGTQAKLFACYRKIRNKSLGSFCTLVRRVGDG